MIFYSWCWICWGYFSLTSLRKSKYSVALLEAGPEDNTESAKNADIPSEFLTGLISDLTWNFVTVPQTHGGLSMNNKVRGRLLIISVGWLFPYKKKKNNNK